MTQLLVYNCILINKLALNNLKSTAYIGINVLILRYQGYQ